MYRTRATKLCIAPEPIPKPVNKDSVAVFIESIDKYVAKITNDSPLDLIRQIRVDMPRISAYINGHAVCDATSLFTLLAESDVRMFAFFQQGCLAPSLQRLCTCMDEWIVADGRGCMLIQATTHGNDWKIDIHKTMFVYDGVLEHVGNVEIWLHVSPQCVMEIYDLYDV